MVDKSTDHRNDAMVEQFVFHFLTHSTFPETSTEMVVKNCQCYCKKQIDDNRFKCSQNIASLNVLMMLTVSMTVSHFCQNLENIKSVRSLK